MDAISALFKALEAGLSIWLSKEKTKYTDRLLKIKEDYYREKTKADPNMAVLDDLEFQLFLLSSTFATSAASGQASSVQSG